MEAKLRSALWLAFSCGVAYLKGFWSPDAGPLTTATLKLVNPLTGQIDEYPVGQDGQPLTDEQMQPLTNHDEAFKYRPGDTDTAVRTIFNVRLNPDAEGLLPSEGFRWLIDSEVVPISVVKERYGEAAKNVQTVEGITQLKQYESLIRTVGHKAENRQGNELLAGRDGRQIPDKELTLLSEYWEAATESLPGGRLIVIAGDEMLYDGELPQGYVDYTPIYDERREFDAYGRPTMDDLIDPQKVINKQWALILEEMALSGIGQWAYFDVPGLSDQITNLSAAHIKIPERSAVMNRSIGDIVQRVPPASVAPDRWRMIEAAQLAMYTIGAFNDVQRGQVPGSVESGVAIELLQEAQNGQLHDSVKTLKRSLVNWATNKVRMARWGYGPDEKRWIPVDRPDLGFMVEAVTGEDLPDPETIKIDLEGFRPTSQTAQNAEIREAMLQGWIMPRDGLRMMDLGRGVDGLFESETRHYARARRENLSIEKQECVPVEHPEGSPLQGLPALVHPEDGSPYLLPTNDDHETHIRIHEDVLLDDTKPWPVRQLMAIHINEHQSMLKLQSAQMMAIEAGQEQAKRAQPEAA